jgi:hypothetical protein
VNNQVVLPEGESGSRLLHRLVSEVAHAFANDLPGFRFSSDAAAFKKNYGDALARFESARQASPKRLEIARALCDAIAKTCTYDGLPIREALARPVDAVASMPEVMTGNGPPDLRIEIPFEGKIVRGNAVHALVDKLHDEHHMSDAARDGLHFIVDHADRHDGMIDLRGKKFAIMGAAAELSPASLLLRGGASVLWIDPQRPISSAAGTVIYDADARDVLEEPAEIVRAIERFADGVAVHVGMFAYAPGKGRELRLAETMNAIIERLGKTAASVSLFVSPTSPAELQPEDAAVIDGRKTSPTTWQRALELSGIIHGPGYYGHGNHAVPRAVISLQGASYQAAQYLSKILRAEVWAHDGLHVSANVAGISRTRSLEHPLFLAAFEGAPAFGVRIFDADTTRALATLLMLSDLLRPKQPANRVHRAQIHGGVYALPWQFEASVKAAAVLGAAKKPGVFFRKKKRAPTPAPAHGST